MSKLITIFSLAVLALFCFPANIQARPLVSDMVQIRQSQATARMSQRLDRKTKEARNNVWYYQRLMGLHLSPVSHKRPSNSLAHKKWVLSIWQVRVQRLGHKAHNLPNYHQWICIHQKEGAWDSHTGNGYYGGLQMDLSFQHSYGAYFLHHKGTADNWRPIEQIWVAERARASGRGYHPWPNTARACGLI